MKVDFVRFNTPDNIELRGWLSNEPGETAVIHIHGMSGNGYENHFLDNLREMFVKNGLSFFTIDTRGSGIINSFCKGINQNSWGGETKLGGSCYEIFEESEQDIQGAIDYLKTLGKTKFTLMGHSLGGSKVVNFLSRNDHPEIIAAILLAPTDMVGWANTDLNNESYLNKAKELLVQKKGEKLVGAQCWLDETPLSAQTYPTISEIGSPVDIYGRGRRSPLETIKIPMIITYGDSDIGITKIDGTIDKWLERAEKIKNDNTQISIIKGASHSFAGKEKELASILESFLSENIK